MRTSLSDTAWVLVADSTRARIFEKAPNQGDCREVANFLNPEGRMKEGELITDAHSRLYDKGRTGESHTTGPRT